MEIKNNKYSGETNFEVKGMFLTRVNDRDGTNRDETKARPRIGSWTRDDSFPLSFFSLVSSLRRCYEISFIAPADNFRIA